MILRKFVRVNFVPSRYKSALYVTGNKAHMTYSLLTPHIDFEERIKNINELRENIKARKKDIDLDKILKNWTFYKTLIEDLAVMDVTKQALSRDIVELLKNKDKESELKNLKEQARQLKSNYNTLKDYIYPVEESAALNALSIPNVLDKRTPVDTETTIHTMYKRPTAKAKDHLTIAVEKKMLHFLNPHFLFLKNEAAGFEYALTSYAEETLQNAFFIPIISPSFVRSAIVEGCCTDFSDGNKVFTVHEDESKYSLNRLHLVGGASLESFMGYFARFSIQTGYFPVKLYSTGKIYQPVNTTENTLFNLSQYSATRVFTITLDDDFEYKSSFDEIVKTAQKFYDSLGYHYIMSYVPASALEDYESLRLSIQMYSANQQKYVQVGYVSVCENYLSKRLLVTYKGDQNVRYSRIVTGILMNVQKLLACILEYNDVEAKQFSLNLISKKVVT